MIAWPASLVDALARRRCVIVIGSGVSANSQTADGRRPRTWGAFLDTLYASLNKRVNHISAALSQYRYLEASSYLKNELGAEWSGALKAEFGDPVYRSASIHEHIFNLDVRIVASMNFDKIYDTYAITSSEGTVSVKSYDNAELRSAASGVGRYVIKLHGTIDTVPTLIFTLEDYSKARIKHAGFYEILVALLHTHTFLFIGCGLNDPDMQLVFEDHFNKFGEAPHFMTLPSPFSEKQISLIRDTRGINVLKYSSKNFHNDLTVSLGELVKLVSVKRDEIVASRDW